MILFLHPSQIYKHHTNELTKGKIPGTEHLKDFKRQN